MFHPEWALHAARNQIFEPRPMAHGLPVKPFERLPLDLLLQEKQCLALPPLRRKARSTAQSSQRCVAATTAMDLYLSKLLRLCPPQLIELQVVDLRLNARKCRVSPHLFG